MSLALERKVTPLPLRQAKKMQGWVPMRPAADDIDDDDDDGDGDGDDSCSQHLSSYSYVLYSHWMFHS